MTQKYFYLGLIIIFILSNGCKKENSNPISSSNQETVPPFDTLVPWINVASLGVESFSVCNNVLYAGGIGVFMTTDEGATWIEKDSGVSDQTITCLASNQGNLFAGTRSGLFISKNYGTSWEQIDTSLHDNYSKWVESIFVHDTLLLMSRFYAPLCWTSNNGKNWVDIYNGPNASYINAFLAFSENIYAGSDENIFKSSNNGTNWDAVGNGLTVHWITTIEQNNNNLFVGTNVGGVFISSDSGASWHSACNGLTNLNIQYMVANDKYIFAGTMNGIFFSTDNGSNWKSANLGLTNPLVWSLIIFKNNIYGCIATGNGNMFSTAIWKHPL